MNKHCHKCKLCGTIWEHSDNCVNSISDHECPNCGEESWSHYLLQRREKIDYRKTWGKYRKTDASKK